ncbi:MAG: hypothetical protein H0W29_01365 [Gemmatimonadales bacterium]|nr:hypothetical protein [Gemmatimonadales bacterium]
MERAFIAPDRRLWLVRPRAAVRRNETATHITLELMTDDETRVVSCRRDEWDVAAPDFAALLARSVPGGASRNVARPGDDDALFDPE